MIGSIRVDSDLIWDLNVKRLLLNTGLMRCILLHGWTCGDSHRNDCEKVGIAGVTIAKESWAVQLSFEKDHVDSEKTVWCDCRDV